MSAPSPCAVVDGLGQRGLRILHEDAQIRRSPSAGVSRPSRRPSFDRALPGASLQRETAPLGTRVSSACRVRAKPAETRSSMRSSMRFLRHGGIYRSDRGQHLLIPVACRLPLVGARVPVKGRDGRNSPCLSASSAISSGRLFLDRFGPHQSPSPLHRQLHPKTVPGWGTIKWQRTANSVLTVCLTQGSNPK